MALPKQATPVFTMTIPSSKQKIKFRPFLVKEEKALLIAQATENPKIMIDTMKSVLQSVLIDEVNIDNLAVFDLEYMFLQVRGKSVGEDVALLFACDVDHGELNDKAKTRVTVNIDDINVVFNDDHTNKIPLFDEVGVIMKYPTLDLTDELSEEDLENTDVLMRVVADLIDIIYDKDSTYSAKETPKEELLDFLGNLTSEQFAKIEEFFLTMPRLSAKVEYTCPVCGLEHHKTLEGLANFT